MSDPPELVHAIEAWRLLRLLMEGGGGLRDSDMLVPNAVGNLAIVRDGKIVGSIDLLFIGRDEKFSLDQVAWFDKPLSATKLLPDNFPWPNKGQT